MTSTSDEAPRCQQVLHTEWCSRPESQHHVGYGHPFLAPPDEAKPHEIARASAVTEWGCPFCGEPNDVHGEGALYSWMECGKCFKHAFLVSEYDEADAAECATSAHA